MLIKLKITDKMLNIIQRRKSRKVKVGKLFVGGDAPITIQSMTTTDTTDVKATVEQLRINPGNIGNPDKVRQVVQACKDYGVPMRIGVNLGSLERDLFGKYGYAPEAMVESAMRHIKILEDLDFYDTIVSLKASDVPRMVAAYRLF